MGNSLSSDQVKSAFDVYYQPKGSYASPNDVTNAINTVNANISSEMSKLNNDLPSKTLWCADGTMCSTPATSQTINFTGNTNVAGDLAVKGKLNVSNMSDFKGAPGDLSAFTDIGLNDKALHIRAMADNNHILQYDNEVDGPRLMGCSGGRLGTVCGGVNTVMTWDKTGTAKFTKIKIGDWTIREDGTDLVFVKGAAIDAPDNGFIRMSQDGNIKLNRSSMPQPKWVADAINSCIRKDTSYGIRSSRGGFLSDQGGWKAVPTKASDWEAMKILDLGQQGT